MQLFSELFPKKKNGINIYFKLLSTIIHPYLKFAHLSPQIGSSYSETTRINIRFTRFLIVCYRFLVKYCMFLIHVILLKVFICLQHRTINILQYYIIIIYYLRSLSTIFYRTPLFHLFIHAITLHSIYMLQKKQTMLQRLLHYAYVIHVTAIQYQHAHMFTNLS